MTADSPKHGLKKGLNRRTFLKGALAAGAVATAASMSGCASQGSSRSGNLASTGYESSESWLGSAPSVGKISQKLSSDILVIGGGNAGIQAALAAAESGASVNVIEASSEDDRQVKGMSVGCVNPRILTDRGIGPFDTSAIYNELCFRAGPGANQELIRKYVANSGETLDHMLSLVNWPDRYIKLASMSSSNISPLDESQLILSTGGGNSAEHAYGGYRSWASSVYFAGSAQHDTVDSVFALSRLDEIQQFSIRKGKDLGARWYFGQTVVKLQQDSSGMVTGAIAKTADGSYVAYDASFGTILCAGDYSANESMVWNLNSRTAEQAARAGASAAETKGASGCDGSGQKMGCWAGGAIQADPRGSLNMAAGGGGPWGVAPLLWVNASGKRFMNEAATPLALETALLQPAGILATLCDASWVDTVKATPLDAGMPLSMRQSYLDDLTSDLAAVPVGGLAGGQCRSCASVLREKVTVYAASSIEALCNMLGYKGDAKTALLKTVERYNDLCAAGTDSDFGKDSELMKPLTHPPFYAAVKENKRYENVGLVTLAGLVTDGELHVLNAKGEVIKGLYAAGNCLGGRFGISYAAPYPGLSVGMAITHGRVAGKIATGQNVS